MQKIVETDGSGYRFSKGYDEQGVLLHVGGNGVV